MRGILQFVGGAWLILVGVPVLVGVTWAAGSSSAALAPSFFPTLADDVVARVPGLVESGFAALQEPGVVEDPNARAWVVAISQAQPPLPDLLRQSGFDAWLQGSLAPALRDVGRVVAGDVPAEAPAIDLRPLRAALESPVAEAWARDVLARLPACDAAQLEAWRARALAGAQGDGPPPACHPGEEVVQRAFAALRAHTARMPAEQPLFEAAPPAPLDWVARSRGYVWLLFLVPALVIAVGAALAGRGARGFLGWSGGTTLAGGAIAAFLAWIAGAWFVPLLPWDAVRAGVVQDPQSALLTTEAGRVFASQLFEVTAQVLDPLFASVRTVALVVAGVGLAVALLSRLARPAAPPELRSASR
jgi:hypothetical protein